MPSRQRILEGIVTTVNEDGTTNVSPMGPIVDDSMTHLTLRPYQTSTTYRNLKRTESGVLHVTDDVELLAHSAVGKIVLPELGASERKDLSKRDSDGGVCNDLRILADACRWYAFRVTKLDDVKDRTTIECSVFENGRLRDFFGFNRAKHAVVEAAILATRVGILSDEKIRQEMAALDVIVEKTGGDSEHRAFEFLQTFVSQRIRL